MTASAHVDQSGFVMSVLLLIGSKMRIRAIVLHPLLWLAEARHEASLSNGSCSTGLVTFSHLESVRR